MRALAVVAALVMTLSAAVPAQAAEAQVWTFLHADRLQEQGTYTPVQSGSQNVIATVSRPSGDSAASTGRYRVSLTNVGPPGAAGVPIVTAVNSAGVHCQVAAFGLSGTTETIDVECYAGTVRANSRFMLSFFSSTSPDGRPTVGAYGYVFNNQPTLNDYRTAPRYNSTGGDVHIYRAGSGDAGAGKRWDVWTARFFGGRFRNNAGNVQVTPVGTVPARCAVFQWYQHSQGVDAQIRCDRAATTGPPQWTLTYTHDRSIVGGTSGFFGYLQANDPTSPDYTPAPPRNRAPDGYSHTVTRSDPGRYQVQVYGPLKAPVSLQVSANGHTDNFCTLTGWTVTPNVQPAGRVDLACHDRNGAPADSLYSLNYYAP
jgi:hypothetical protein